MKALFLILAGGLIAVSGQAAADGNAGAPCSAAASANGKAVCASTALTRLDAQASILFEVRMMLPMLMGERGAARDANTAFSEKLGTCGADATCLAAAYEARIAALKETVESAMDDFCKLKGIC